MRLVLDTNILVSSIISPHGPANMTVALTAHRRFQFCASVAIFAEYREVLDRRCRTYHNPERYLNALWKTVTLVTPRRAVRVSPDPDDDIFLECAEAAKAHYLVTRNTRDFPKRWKYTEIVTPRQLLDRLATSPQSVS